MVDLMLFTSLREHYLTFHSNAKAQTKPNLTTSRNSAFGGTLARRESYSKCAYFVIRERDTSSHLISIVRVTCFLSNVRAKSGVPTMELESELNALNICNFLYQAKYYACYEDMYFLSISNQHSN